jgi:nucleoside-diphosphate-sugar epimerase
MNDKSSILILGVASTVGRELLKAACAIGIRTRVLVRSKVRAGEIPSGVYQGESYEGHFFIYIEILSMGNKGHSILGEIYGMY